MVLTKSLMNELSFMMMSYVSPNLREFLNSNSGPYGS